MCPQNELLWNSGDTPNNEWTTYVIDFIPSDNYTHIMLQINALDSSGNGYILIDNMSPITPACQIIAVDNFQNSCTGNDGFIETIIVDELDGTPPYNYMWSNNETTPNILRCGSLCVNNFGGSCEITADWVF